MIITVIVFQRINSVLPNKLMPNYRKVNWSNIKLPNKFKPNCRKILFQIAEHKIFGLPLYVNTLIYGWLQT